MSTRLLAGNNQDVNKLGNESLKTIVKYAKAQQGLEALAVREQPNDEHLSIRATYGVSRSSLGERIEMGSGLLGETYRDGERKVLENLPGISQNRIWSEAQPASIVLVPLKTEDGEMIGVMELAFLGRSVSYGPYVPG